MPETTDRLQFSFISEKSLAPQTYEIVHLLPPKNFTPNDYIPDGNAALAETIRMLGADSRLQRIAPLIYKHNYQELRESSHDEIAEYGYFFDGNDNVVARINQENGDVSLPAKLLLSEIQPSENRGNDFRTALYTEMLKKGSPPPIFVAGLTQNHNIFRIIEGNAQFAAAKQAGKHNLLSWVFLKNAQEMRLRIPPAIHENPVEIKLAQRFAEAMRTVLR
jgi:hypothetical protein